MRLRNILRVGIVAYLLMYALGGIRANADDRDVYVTSTPPGVGAAP